MTDYVTREEWEQYCRIRRNELDRELEKINRHLRSEYKLEQAERKKPKPPPPPKPVEPPTIEDNDYVDYIFNLDGLVRVEASEEDDD